MPKEWIELEDDDVIALDEQSEQVKSSSPTPPPPHNDLEQPSPEHFALPQSNSNAKHEQHALTEKDVEEEETDTIYLANIDEETQQTSLKQEPISVITGEGAQLSWFEPPAEPLKK